MPFATPEDVATRLGRELDPTEAGTVDMLLKAAAASIAEAADKDDAWADSLDPVPRLLNGLCVDVVCRCLANPESLAGFSEQIGTYQVSKRFKAGSEALNSDLMLTPMERRRVRRAVQRSSFVPMTLESPYSGPTHLEDPLP